MWVWLLSECAMGFGLWKDSALVVVVVLTWARGVRAITRVGGGVCAGIMRDQARRIDIIRD